jgi:peptidylprolyl isomerase
MIGKGERRMRTLLLLGAAALLGGAAPAKKPLTPTDIVNAAPANAWKTIAPDNLMVMELKGGGRIVIQLAPRFAPVHVGNVQALARGNYWDGATIYRLQDNYVAQWGLT